MTTSQILFCVWFAALIQPAFWTIMVRRKPSNSKRFSDLALSCVIGIVVASMIVAPAASSWEVWLSFYIPPMLAFTIFGIWTELINWFCPLAKNST
jgi:hypothetical protein